MNTIDEMDDVLLDDQLVLLFEVKLEPELNIQNKINYLKKNSLNQHFHNEQQYIKQLEAYIVEQVHLN